jgi:hypothetical protein
MARAVKDGIVGAVYMKMDFATVTISRCFLAIPLGGISKEVRVQDGAYHKSPIASANRGLEAFKPILRE